MHPFFVVLIQSHLSSIRPHFSLFLNTILSILIFAFLKDNFIPSPPPNCIGIIGIPAGIDIAGIDQPGADAAAVVSMGAAVSRVASSFDQRCIMGCWLLSRYSFRDL